MKNEFLKTLWMLRFEKIKRDEEKAVRTYENLKTQCGEHLRENHKVIELLDQLICEEKAHVRMADELMRICLKSHPECETPESLG